MGAAGGFSAPFIRHAHGPLLTPYPAGACACSCVQMRNRSHGRRDLLPATKEFSLKAGKQPQDLGCRFPAQHRSCKEVFGEYSRPCRGARCPILHYTFSNERAVQRSISIGILLPGQPPAPPGSGSHKLCVNTCSAHTQHRILFPGRYGGGWRGRRVDPVMWKLESYSRDNLVGEGAAWRSRR